MFNTINSLNNFTEIINANDAVLIYFSHEACNVCKVLKPKVAELINTKYSNIKLYYSDTRVYPDIAAQNSIFTVPTLLIFFGGKEHIIKSRNIGINELDNLIERPYKMIFE